MGIKGIKKRVGCFMLAFSLSFGICATDYLEVQALEWAGTVIGLEEALKFLLGLIGVTVGVGVAENIDWQSMRENAIDYQIAQGQSAVAVSNWWADVIHGSLDTASQCWASFKDWVKNDLLSASSGGGSIEYYNGSLSDLIDTIPYPFNFSYTGLTGSANRDVTNACGFYTFQNGKCISVSVFFDVSASYTQTENGVRVSYTNLDSSVYWTQGLSLDSNHPSGQISSSRNYSNTFYYTNTVGFGIFPYSNLFGNPAYANPIDEWTLDGNSTSDNFDSAFSNVQDIALSPDIATDLPFDGVIDIPWENVGATDEAVGEAIDGAQEKVITGEWTLDQYWTWVQNVTNVFAYDITNNYLLPNNGNNETADDKVQENINRGAFVLAGLEKVFPFCIPWDIYAFVTLLVADPVAPVIEYPIYNPVTKDEEVITIDFSVWEQQVIIMRYIMDFLLIIGLLLLARSLIGAGGSD